MNTKSQQAKDIFLDLVGNVPPDQWEDRLARASSGDEQLRDRVRALLRAHAEPDSFLESPAVAIADPPLEKPGTLIGPYKLVEQIGEGGFGAVYLAEQTEPVRRRVALKIIKPGMDTHEVVARFEAERQAVAIMNHPNIAKVLDAGTTDAGRPYFVMELVRGVPITEYCDHCSLTTRERLELFASVCQAVQHAHHKGIIHRDIKPSNVLIAMQDGRPAAKVIDFGVAKAVAHQLTERTVHTGYAQMLGTPLYMSPEQAEMSPLEIDTRADVYSLGVLLYELLTGTTPFEKERLREAAIDELRRIIREEEPPRPSAQLSTLDGQLAETVAEGRRTEPRKLEKLVRGDLDWIVMKALEKDRTRRYETANELARDVDRFLSDEPVEACPSSPSYRMRKFARRYRTALATAAAAFVLVIGGLAVSTWVIAGALAQTRQQRDVARENLYLAHMRQTQQDWEAGQVGRMQNLLDKYLPAPAWPDLRGWEWYYLKSLTQKDLFTLY